MYQRSNAQFIVMKGLMAKQTHKEKLEVFRPETVQYSAVIQSVRQTIRSFTEIDHASLNALGEFPFSSVQEIVQPTFLPKSAICRHLTCSLGFCTSHLRSVFQALGKVRCIVKVSTLQALLQRLLDMERNNIHDIFPPNESWFSLNRDSGLCRFHRGRATGKGQVDIRLHKIDGGPCLKGNSVSSS